MSKHQKHNRRILMTGKTQFQKVKNELPYVSKDGKWYQLKFYDAENGCYHFMITESHKGRRKSNIPTYEDVKDKYNIELEDIIPTPTQYFNKKVGEPSNSNILRTVSDKTFISYIKCHMEEVESIEAVDKLKNVVHTHKDKKVRKAAYETLFTIGAKGLDDIEKYIDHPEITEVENDEVDHTEVKKSIPNRTNTLNKEKAIIIYMALVKKYKKHRKKITCSVFLNAWKEMFECNKYNVSKESYRKIHDMQVAAFAYVKGEFDDKSYEEIKSVRDTFMIYPSREVPVELKQLAQSKRVVITLAENIDKHLSGFNVLVRENKYMTYKINDVPYGLSVSGAKKLLKSLPDASELKKKEKAIMDTIKSDSIKLTNKRKAVDKYNAPYATHDFKVFMNRYTIYDCKDKQLTNACVNLCRRVGINNLSNEKPIDYKFCVGSGKRKQSMKRAKGRRKANTKNRKGKK